MAFRHFKCPHTFVGHCVKIKTSVDQGDNRPYTRKICTNYVFPSKCITFPVGILLNIVG